MVELGRFPQYSIRSSSLPYFPSCNALCRGGRVSVLTDIPMGAIFLPGPLGQNINTGQGGNQTHPDDPSVKFLSHRRHSIGRT